MSFRPDPLVWLLRRYYALFTLLNFAGSLPAVPHSFMRVMPRRSRGGDEEVRTPDPLRARQVLSQLSYTPILIRGPELSSLVSLW